MDRDSVGRKRLILKRFAQAANCLSARRGKPYNVGHLSVDMSALPIKIHRHNARCLVPNGFFVARKQPALPPPSILRESDYAEPIVPSKHFIRFRFEHRAAAMPAGHRAAPETAAARRFAGRAADCVLLLRTVHPHAPVVRNCRAAAGRQGHRFCRRREHQREKRRNAGRYRADYLQLCRCDCPTPPERRRGARVGRIFARARD